MNQYIENAEKFLKNCVFDGLAHSWDVNSKQFVKPYPEVTGYVIKYLCDNSNGWEFENIINAKNELIKLQHRKGGYKTFFDDRFLYPFDTAQIMNGLISFYKKSPDDKLLQTILKGGDFLLYMQRNDGGFYPIYDVRFHIRRCPKNMYTLWNGPMSGINCKIIEVLDSYYNLTKDEKFIAAIKKATDYYLNAKPLVHTHPLGYWLEGLYQADQKDFVKKYLADYVINRIENNGFISYDGKLDYSYMSGQIQLGILLAKCGYTEEAIRIRNFARMVQENNESGGIIQYATRDAGIDSHVHTEVNSWGTKYFCELERLLEKYE